MADNTNTPLTYQKKWDLGNKPVSPTFVKCYGLAIFILECGYLWKFHKHHVAAVWQVCMIALVAALAVAVVAHFWTETDRTRAFFIFYQLTFVVTFGISLFGL
ncbi:MAG: hypothetical protein WA211_18300 [Candidatus Acidiferrales bacterium]